MTPLDAQIVALRAQVDQANKFYNDYLNHTIARYRHLLITHPQLAPEEAVSVLTKQLVTGDRHTWTREVDDDNGRIDLCNQLAIAIDRLARLGRSPSGPR